MEISRTTKIKIDQFRADMYTHVSSAHYNAHYKSCWKCNHFFIDGESVNIMRSRGNGNYAICTECAQEIGLMDLVDERGFANLEEK